MKPVFHRPGNGETHQMGPSQIVIKAASEHTEGKFFLSESTIAPGFPGPPPHVHDELHDMFYVLDGALTMRLGDEEVIAEPGTFVCVPPGVVHTFSNRSEQPVRFLNFNTPGGWERYMRELVAAAREPAVSCPPRRSAASPPGTTSGPPGRRSGALLSVGKRLPPRCSRWKSARP